MPSARAAFIDTVARIAAAHETDLDQAVAMPDLRFDDAQARVGRGRQRLFAEDGLATRDRSQDEFLVGGAPRRDDHTVDVG